MNIVLGEENVAAIRDRYTVLTLDSFQIPGHDQPVRSYCVIETVPLTEIKQIDQWRDLHENLIVEYGRQNWNYCEQALDHLRSRWGGALDTFYLELSARIEKFKQQDFDPDWSPVITR